MAMRMFAAITAALAVLSPATAGGRPPDFAWRVIDAAPGKGSVLMASAPVRGPSTARVVGTLTVAAMVPQTLDAVLEWWTIDCAAKTIAGSSAGFWKGPTLSPTPMVNYADGTDIEARFHTIIADYACDNRRKSKDPALFWGDGEAVAYARALAAKNQATPASSP